MTAAQHYQKAEDLLATAERWLEPDRGRIVSGAEQRDRLAAVERTVARAQVHATLAVGRVRP